MLNTQGFLLMRGPGVYKLATMAAFSQRSAEFRRDGAGAGAPEGGAARVGVRGRRWLKGPDTVNAGWGEQFIE